MACGGAHSLALWQPGAGACEAGPAARGEGGLEGAGGGEGGDDDGGEAGRVVAEPGGQVYAWGALERGELGLELGLGFPAKLLEARLSPVTLGPVTHAGAECKACKSASIAGTRFLAVGGAGVDVCGRCMAKHGGAGLARGFVGNQHVMLAAHRKLPPGFQAHLAAAPPAASSPAPPLDMREIHAALAAPLQADTLAQTQARTHVGVVCQACALAPLVGCRFLCANCADDFSLCEECYGKERGRHLSTHLFLRIPRHLPQLAQYLAARGRRPLLPLLFPQVTADVFVLP